MVCLGYCLLLMTYLHAFFELIVLEQMTLAVVVEVVVVAVGVVVVAVG